MKGQLTAEVKFAPFSCSGVRRGHQTDPEEEELGLVVGEALSSTVCLHRSVWGGVTDKMVIRLFFKR